MSKLMMAVMHTEEPSTASCKQAQQHKGAGRRAFRNDSTGDGLQMPTAAAGAVGLCPAGTFGCGQSTLPDAPIGSFVARIHALISDKHRQTGCKAPCDLNRQSKFQR